MPALAREGRGKARVRVYLASLISLSTAEFVNMFRWITARGYYTIHSAAPTLSRADNSLVRAETVEASHFKVYF